MYCPNCGAPDIGPDVKYCPMCGTETSHPQGNSQMMQSNTTNPYVSQPSRPRPRPTPIQSVPLYQASSTGIRPTGIGPHSKKCLGFSLASLGLFIAGIAVGFAVAAPSIFSSLSYYYGFSMFNMPTVMRLIGLIPAAALNILGFIFGIVARMNSSRAQSEMENAVEKIGSVLSIFGIILNIIGIAAAVLLAPLIILGPGTFSPYYYY